MGLMSRIRQLETRLDEMEGQTDARMTETEGIARAVSSRVDMQYQPVQVEYDEDEDEFLVYVRYLVDPTTAVCYCLKFDPPSSGNRVVVTLMHWPNLRHEDAYYSGDTRIHRDTFPNACWSTAEYGVNEVTGFRELLTTYYAQNNPNVQHIRVPADALSGGYGDTVIEYAVLNSNNTASIGYAAYLEAALGYPWWNVNDELYVDRAHKQRWMTLQPKDGPYGYELYHKESATLVYFAGTHYVTINAGEDKDIYVCAYTGAPPQICTTDYGVPCTETNTTHMGRLAIRSDGSISAINMARTSIFTEARGCGINDFVFARGIGGTPSITVDGTTYTFHFDNGIFSGMTTV